MITINKVRGLFKEYIENDLRENDFYYYLDKNPKVNYFPSGSVTIRNDSLIIIYPPGGIK